MRNEYLHTKYRRRAAQLAGLLLLSALTIAGLAIVKSKSAECAWCPTYACYGPCLGKCACVTPAGEFSGKCVGIEYADEYEARGWSVAR